MPSRKPTCLMLTATFPAEELWWHEFVTILIEIGGLMKQLTILLALLLFVISAASVAEDAPLPEPTQNPTAAYRLFRTQNIYTLLKLDTRTGLVWQVQWGTDDDHRFVAPISSTPLIPLGKTSHPTILKAGRFTMSPTSNIFTFLLLDQENGRTWQVQWNSDEKQRFVTAIP